MLQRGIRLNDGVSNPALEEVRGGVGAARIRLLRDKLLALPTDTGGWPRSCRYVGRPFGHHVEGKALKPGDVVTLGREPFLALADRFVTVEAKGG